MCQHVSRSSHSVPCKAAWPRCRFSNGEISERASTELPLDTSAINSAGKRVAVEHGAGLSIFELSGTEFEPREFKKPWDTCESLTLTQDAAYCLQFPYGIDRVSLE